MEDEKKLSSPLSTASASSPTSFVRLCVRMMRYFAMIILFCLFHTVAGFKGCGERGGGHPPVHTEADATWNGSFSLSIRLAIATTTITLLLVFSLSKQLFRSADRPPGAHTRTQAHLHMYVCFELLLAWELMSGESACRGAARLCCLCLVMWCPCCFLSAGERQRRRPWVWAEE